MTTHPRFVFHIPTQRNIVPAENATPLLTTGTIRSYKHQKSSCSSYSSLKFCSVLLHGYCPEFSRTCRSPLDYHACNAGNTGACTVPKTVFVYSFAQPFTAGSPGVLHGVAVLPAHARG